ncbi:MAG TPA: hypothetical protein VLA68_06535 [Nitrososphaera sp.]|nr:hypothetical protein [Nitrososphaera sp.]
MKRKTRVKGGKSRIAASKLRARHVMRSKTRGKKPYSRKARSKLRRKTPSSRPKAKSAATLGSAGKRIVRIMGQGQYTVDSKMLKKLNDMDNAIVELVSRERSDDAEFKRKLTELNQMVVKRGRPLDPKAIIQSDIILPSVDLSIDEAKRLFKGEGVIPEI